MMDLVQPHLWTMFFYCTNSHIYNEIRGKYEWWT